MKAKHEDEKMKVRKSREQMRTVIVETMPVSMCVYVYEIDSCGVCVYIYALLCACVLCLHVCVMCVCVCMCDYQRIN